MKAGAEILSPHRDRPQAGEKIRYVQRKLDLIIAANTGPGPRGNSLGCRHEE